MNNTTLDNTSVSQAQSLDITPVSADKGNVPQQSPAVSLVPVFFIYGVTIVLSLALVTVLSISGTNKPQIKESSPNEVSNSYVSESVPAPYVRTPAQEQYPNTTQTNENQSTVNTNIVAPISYEVQGPEVNKMSCLTPSKKGLQKGEIACYGVWDLGRAFGEDAYMCREGSGDVGCVITTPACLSGSATAATFVNVRTNGIDRTILAEVVKNLDTTDDVVLANILHLWVYTCN